MATNVGQPLQDDRASTALDSSADNTKPFATLTPVNALAKMAFSDVFEATRVGGQTQNNSPLLRMAVQDEQCYDADVARFRMEEERLRETSESLTELDTDAEASDNGELGMIWAGQYVFALVPNPNDISMGWTAGKGTPKHGPCDLLLSTKAFASKHSTLLRTFHARFHFAKDTAVFFVARLTKSSHDELTINGTPLLDRQMHTLNQHTMQIRLGKLEYAFEYTKFADTDLFFKLRRQYIAQSLGGPSKSAFDMPTPGQETTTMGQWTLSNTLGKGTAGRVFLASNAKNEVVALKIIERQASTADRINAEIARYQEVTDLAKDDDDGARIVRLKDVIYHKGKKQFTPDSAFDQVGLVIEPLAPTTLDSYIKNIKPGRQQGMSLECATLFRDALRGLRFLHAHGWVHCDVKPQNIGVLTQPLRAVLLDLESLTPLSLGTKLRATPGSSGTINYLSPEREMYEYDHGADVWPMGVIGYELTYGSHPFFFAVNPWRHGPAYEQLRPSWEAKYKRSIDKLSIDYEKWSAQKRTGNDRHYLHFGDLLAQMIRYSWAKNNSGPRISIKNALEHQIW